MRLDTPITAVLIISAACLSIFYLESIGRVSEEDFGARSGVMAEEPWRLFTFEFTHDGADHLVMNLLGLMLAGLLAFGLGMRGSVFTGIFLAAGSLTVLPPLLTSCPYTFVGASAGVCGLFGAVAARLRRYGLPPLPILMVFLLSLTASPAIEALSGSSVAAIEALIHSFGVVIGAGLALVCEGITPLGMGEIEVKVGVSGAGVQRK